MKEKMMKTAKGLDVFVSIIEKILWGACALVLLGFVLVMVFSAQNPDIINTLSYSFGDVAVTLNESSVTPELVKTVVFSSLVTAVVTLALTCLGIRIIRRILKPMKVGRPFDTSVADSLKQLGWLVFAGGVIRIVGEAVVYYIFTNSLDFTAVFNPDTVSGVNIRVGSDLTFIVYTFVLFLMSYVFRYGEELQKESDETL
ncbi:MAG: DUF2975 domain-containing protein [Solobacterium sp.]|nr:DUF2975 domain-containing protein [Solobacterium sp.]